MTTQTLVEYPWLTPQNCTLLKEVISSYDLDNPLDSENDTLLVDHTNASWPKILQCIKATINGTKTDYCREIIVSLAKSNTPFVMFSHQFGNLRNKLIKQSLTDMGKDASLRLMALMEQMEDSFAQIYLEIFLQRISLRNHLRLNHIRQLKDKNLLKHFESHLMWMEQLIDAVDKRNIHLLPEQCHESCTFGQWLLNDGEELIRDRSHLKQIKLLHQTMHFVIKEINDLLTNKHTNAPIYAMLKKAEMHSLELGNEISLLNNIVIMNVYSKDPLTSLLSRHFLDRVLYGQMEVAKATEVPFSIIMLDLDHFKNINDTYGHVVGDKMLVHISHLVRNLLRKSDLIFRYGGEEFMIVCPSTDINQARQLAEKLRHLIANTPLNLDDKSITISASFGVTEVAPHSYQVVDAQLVNEIIDSCDGWLYAAKRSGRNCVF